MIITINDIKWEVVVKTNDDMPSKPKDADIVALGRTCESTLRIYLNKEVDKQVFRKTIIHELTHAYINSYGFTQVVLDDEVMCDFMGAYADSIVRLADSIIETFIVAITLSGCDSNENKHSAKEQAILEVENDYHRKGIRK